MNKSLESFMVSHTREGNCETPHSNHETIHETAMKQLDLIALAMQVLGASQGNSSGNFYETNRFHTDIPSRNQAMHSGKIISLVCSTCGYRKPFCSCKRTPNEGMVSCDMCEHFTPDTIGDGAGIGSCHLGVEFTQEIHGKMPLFRYAERHCGKFIGGTHAHTR